MFLVFFFLQHIKCRIAADEFEIFPITEGVGIAEVTSDDDLPRNSQYAFVSYFSYDDQWNHYMMNVFVLGYSLKQLSPKYDRVLLIPSGLNINNKDMSRIKKLWTHIVRRPFVKWNCSQSEKVASEKHLWFKLQMFTLTQYKKIIYIGPNILVVRDPSELFYYGLVSAPPDFQAWGYSQYGFIHNHEFGSYTPSNQIFRNLTNKCKFMLDPMIHVEKLGPFDNGLLEMHFRSELLTLPEYWQYEVISSEFAKKSAPSNPFDQRIITYRYSVDSRPWGASNTLKNSITSQIYVKSLQKTFEFLQEPLDLQKYQLAEPLDDQDNDFLVKRMAEDVPEKEYITYNFYQDFVDHSKVRQYGRYITIILGSLGIVGFAIAEAPRSSRDAINDELMDDKE